MNLDISGAKILFTLPIDLPILGELRISETLVVSWIVMLLITGVCMWLTHDLKVENISKHATNCTISSELRFCPDIAIRTILFFLILQIKCRYWRMMAALFSNITHSAFRCIYNT